MCKLLWMYISTLRMFKGHVLVRLMTKKLVGQVEAYKSGDLSD